MLNPLKMIEKKSAALKQGSDYRNEILNESRIQPGRLPNGQGNIYDFGR